MDPILLGACLRLLVVPLTPRAEAYGVALDGRVVESVTIEEHESSDVPSGHVGLLVHLSNAVDG